MKTIIPLMRPLVLTLLVLASFVATTLAQEVQIPDPGLDAAIREALEQPNGPLTEQDLLSLINLDASSRGVSSVEGLEAARNLERLFLDSNRLTHFSLPGTLTNLISPIKASASAWCSSRNRNETSTPWTKDTAGIAVTDGFLMRW